jgi:hypothetical protein
MNKSLKTYFIGLFLFAKNPIYLALTVVIAYFSPIAGIIGALLLLLASDFVTGIWAAKKRGEKITSYTMRTKTVQKLLCYLLAIILSFVVQKEIFVYEWAKLVWLTSTLLALAELKSILENMGYITGNKVFNNIFNAINSLFKKNENTAIDNSKSTSTPIKSIPNPKKINPQQNKFD